MENNQVDINLSTDIKTDNLVPLNITLMSRDINNNSFLLKFKSNGADVQLNNSFTVEILSVFPNSKIEILTQATVYGNTAMWEFDTKYITRNEVVSNYVYVKKDGAPIISADANAFTFNVGLSKIDGNAGKTAETYDRNYEKVLHEFEVAINLTKDEWAQMADEAREFVDQIKDVTVDQFVETKMGEELANLEVNYATRLTGLETKDNQLTAQLAETATDINSREVNIMFPPPPLIAAKGDGQTDSRGAIQSAIDYVFAKGGGTVLIPQGIFLLDSTLVGQGDYTILIPRDNVTIRGVGRGSILKVANGMNDRYKGISAPSIFLKTTLLKNFTLENFVVDWNGSNNLLKSDSTRRSNAVLYGAKGGKNILVDRLIVKGLPGNQAIFFSDVDVESNDVGSITVQNCEFIDCGSGLLGNYNSDHSTVFLSGKGDRIINNKFIGSNVVHGSAFEIHGPNSQSYGNYVENYTIGFWIAPHLNKLRDTIIRDNIFNGVVLAWGWGSGHNVGEHGGSIQIENNKFYFRDDMETHRPGDSFSIEGAKVETERLYIDNNEFILTTPKDKVFMQVYKTRNFIFTRNKVENYRKQALRFAGYDFGDGYALDSFIVENNQFVDCGGIDDVVHVESGATTLKARILKVNNNDIINSNVLTTNGIRLGIDVDFGEVVDNNISEGYQYPFYLFNKSDKVKVKHIGDKDQANGVYGAITSEVINRKTGTIFTKIEPNSASWKKTLRGTTPPSSGTYAVGDEVINSNPIAGSYKGWICVSAGSPGTWKGYGMIDI